MVLEILVGILFLSQAATVAVFVIKERRTGRQMEEYRQLALAIPESLARIERLQNSLTHDVLFLKNLPPEISPIITALGNLVIEKSNSVGETVVRASEMIRDTIKLLETSLRDFHLRSSEVERHLTAKSQELVDAISLRSKEMEGHMMEYGEQIVAASTALREQLASMLHLLEDSQSRLKALEHVPMEIITTRTTLHDLLDEKTAGIQEVTNHVDEAVQILRQRNEQIAEDLNVRTNRAVLELSVRSQQLAQDFSDQLKRLVVFYEQSQQLLDDVGARRVALHDQALQLRGEIASQLSRTLTELSLLTLITTLVAGRTLGRVGRAAVSTTYPELLTALRDSGAIPELAQVGDDFKRAKAEQLFPLALKALASMWKPAAEPPVQGEPEDDGSTGR